MDKQIRDRIPKDEYESVAREIEVRADVDRTTVFRFMRRRNLTPGGRVLVALCEMYGITPAQVVDPSFKFPSLEEIVA